MGNSPRSSLFTTKEVGVLVALILGVLLFRIFFKTAPPEPSPAAAPVTSTTMAPVVPNPTAPSPSPSPTPEVAPETSYVPEDPRVRKGLCGFDAKNPMLHWKLVRLMQFQNPKLIALPRYHASCLAGRSAFAVVNYDFTSDLPFDYLGDFRLTAEVVQDFPDLQSFMDIYASRIKEFGFQKTEDLIRWMAALGPTQAEVVVLSVKSKGPFRIRDPIGGFATYPGIRTVSLDTARREVVKDPKIQSISFSTQKDSLGGLTVTAIDPLVISSAQSPSVALDYWKENRGKLGLDSSSRFLVIADSMESAFPVIWGSALRGLGAEDVMVAATSKKPLLTPVSFSGVETLSLSQLIELIPQATVVDTRGATTFRHSVRIEKAVRIPLEKRFFSGQSGDPMLEIPQQLQSGQLSPLYDLSRKPFYEKALLRLKGKDLILIGVDDTDWMPLLLAFHLKKKAQFKIHWFRPGFEALEIYKEVGQEMGDFRKQVKPIRMLKKEVKQIPVKEGERKNNVIILRPRAALKKNKDTSPNGEGHSGSASDQVNPRQTPGK